MSMDAVSPLRQRMIEDMNARKLCAGTQRGHLRSCKRFAAFLKRSPDTATAENAVGCCIGRSTGRDRGRRKHRHHQGCRQALALRT